MNQIKKETVKMSNNDKLTKFLNEHHKLILDCHYGIISCYFNGNPESYIRHYQDKIVGLKKLGDDKWIELKIQYYQNIIDFVIQYIPRKIKWRLQ